MFGEPYRTPYDISFHLFGFPVRIHPMFWVIAALFGVSGTPRDDMRELLIDLLAWITAWFIAILVHELGHAFIQRAYGYSPWIVLHGFGGMAAYHPTTAYGRRPPGTFGNILISAAGPFAGFALAAMVCGIALALGGIPFLRRFDFMIVLGVVNVLSPQFTAFLNYLLWISVSWGILNLMPIYPLDGGHISREILLRVNRSQGIRWSLIVSIVVAFLIGGRFLFLWNDGGRHGFPFAAILFGYLGYSSLQTLQSYNHQRWR